jgi:uncharacterized LabA/DUF88 family protein
MTTHKSNFAFIDSQNLNLATRSQNWQLDYKKFYTYLKHKFFITKAFIFIGYVQENEKLYSFLKNVGYELIFKPVSKSKDGKIKGNVDAELVLHSAKIEYENYDKAVIVSGDGDFYCLADFLEKNQKLERIVVPSKKSGSYLLNKFRSKITFLDGTEKKLGK